MRVRTRCLPVLLHAHRSSPSPGCALAAWCTHQRAVPSARGSDPSPGCLGKVWKPASFVPLRSGARSFRTGLVGSSYFTARPRAGRPVRLRSCFSGLRPALGEGMTRLGGFSAPWQVSATQT